jgi:RNA polymerase sigma-70 factor (ECF subfamily)
MTSFEQITSGENDSSPQRPDDDSLVNETLQGDERAFEQIMRRYNQRLYRLAVSVLGDPSEAQDVLQESYVRAFYSLTTFAGESLGAWLARIVRNESIDRVRARIARSKLVTLEADMQCIHDEEPRSIGETTASEQARFDPETTVAHARMTQVLERAIEALPEQFRTVFVLREVEGLSVNETAEYLNVPVATVKTRDYRARSLLRAQLDRRIDSATKEAFSFMGAQCDAIVEHVLKRIKN